ncbi:MAG: HAD hydrolase family protein [Desulfobacterales bacterium]|jgi:YrbI family 3-deoxy-D-manno-octulosonate 8-phosphate phosphatase
MQNVKTEFKIADSKDIDLNLKNSIRQIRLVAFDFDGVFTDNMVYVLQDGSEAVRCNRSDGIGLQKLKKMGIKTVIISTESNPVVSARAQKLNIQCFQNCEDKRQTLTNLAREFGIALDEIAFVGNDINDRECLTCVGLPVVVQDAHPDVIPLAAHRTRNRGGHGAVREICDLFEQVLAKY